MEDILRALSKVVQQTEELDPLREPLILAAWERIAGESLGRHTNAVKWQEKRLVVAVADEIWKKHLESLSGQMIFRLNSLLRDEAVTFIEFCVDSKFFEQFKNQRQQEAAKKEQYDRDARAEITPRMRMAADEIEDAQLRELFLQAAGNALLRKKHLSL